MPTIETLDGPLDTAQLGTVLMHEHVFNLTAEIQIAHPGFNGWDPEVEVPKAQATLRAAKEAGIDTLVELSPIGLGRSLDLIRRACDGSGLNVVARHRPLHLRRPAAPVALLRSRDAARRRGAARRAHARATSPTGSRAAA